MMAMRSNANMKDDQEGLQLDILD